MWRSTALLKRVHLAVELLPRVVGWRAAAPARAGWSRRPGCIPATAVDRVVVLLGLVAARFRRCVRRCPAVGVGGGGAAAAVAVGSVAAVAAALDAAGGRLVLVGAVRRHASTACVVAIVVCARQASNAARFCAAHRRRDELRQRAHGHQQQRGKRSDRSWARQCSRSAGAAGTCVGRVRRSASAGPAGRRRAVRASRRARRRSRRRAGARGQFGQQRDAGTVDAGDARSSVETARARAAAAAPAATAPRECGAHERAGEAQGFAVAFDSGRDASTARRQRLASACSWPLRRSAATCLIDLWVSSASNCWRKVCTNDTPSTITSNTFQVPPDWRIR